VRRGLAGREGNVKRFFGLVLLLSAFTCAVGGGYYLARSEKVVKEVAYVYVYGIAAGATGALGSMILIANPKKKG
jgi:hypothetical protein